MLKKTILAGAFFLAIGIFNASAQFPAQGINYQAVARNAQGNPITSPITVRISILSGSPTGTLQYQETHNATPNSFGVFNVSIGQGTFNGGAAGSFDNIAWGSATHFSKTEINTGSGYVNMGTSQLWAVPYALYAETSGNGGGGSYTAGSGINIAGNTISAVDNSITNEMQSLALSGNTLSISGGNSVTLPTGGGGSYTAGSGITIAGSVISAVDNSATNEFQNLTLSGATLSISNGNSVTLPTGTTYTAGSGITIAGNTISAADNSATNEFQNLTLSGSTLSISNGNSVTLPTGTTYTAGAGITITGNTIAATDNSVTNEIQSLTLSGNTLSISGGNSVTLPSGSGGGTLDQAYDFGGAGAGKTITADSGPVTINATGTGAAGIGLLVSHSGSNTAAVGVSFSGTGNAIQAASSNAANAFATIQASTNSSTVSNSALFGQSTGAARAIAGQVEASATADVAVRGLNLRTNGGIGVEGVAVNGVSGASSNNQGFGVFATNTGTANVASGYYAVAIAGVAANGVGVQGQTQNAQLPGVLGQNLATGTTYNNIGIYGQSNTGVGVYGESLGNFYGVFAEGDLGASGAKTFLIDHPLDPGGKFLKHFSMESNEVLNIYRGVVTCDASGEAVVTLPDYVEAINRNYSYQLTPIGAYAGLYVKEKMQNGKFRIAGAQPGMEVSWQLVGERNDAYFVKHPEKRQAEVEKAQKGTYISPELHGQSKDTKLFNVAPTLQKIQK